MSEPRNRESPPPELPLRIVVAGDVRLYRDGIAHILSKFDDLRVVATPSTVGAALEAVAAHDPHALLVDMSMPRSLDLLRAVEPAAPVAVALALPEVESTFLTCVEAGMASYVPREATVQELVTAIKGAVRGELTLAPRLAGSLARRVSTLSATLGAPEREFDLTRREAEVARLVANGRSNKGIAAELHIAVPTVKNHVHNILAKMGATRRSDIAAGWLRHSLHEPPHLRARRDLDHLHQREEAR